jgi:hypothetical protein
MLSVVRLECEAYERPGPCHLAVHLSDGGVLRVAVGRDDLRGFEFFQKAVVQQTGTWIHHPSESGRNADRLEWKRMIHNALADFAAAT